ncbi:MULTISPECIES: hypothetical protein [Anaerotruncus]|uniref:hypothetical protein n=1 Tax=Anaerotruncus TaxID=244127 RepID=UPI0023F41073|nr:hypothetical protein [Anaerotruncus massiliensis (ex Togo et al. 2019)]
MRLPDAKAAPARSAAASKDGSSSTPPVIGTSPAAWPRTCSSSCPSTARPSAVPGANSPGAKEITFPRATARAPIASTSGDSPI